MDLSAITGKVALGAALACALAFAPAGRAQGTLPLEANEVANGFERPVYVATAPGQGNTLFVVEQKGTVRVVKDGETLDKPFLNIKSDVSITQPAGEEGLLSIAFPPDYAKSGLFYAYFTNKHCSESWPASGGCDIEVAEFQRSDQRPLHARASTIRPVITIRHRDAPNHDGGTAVFGPDGMLWIGTGDGGGGGDQFDNARQKDKLLGKLLRIDPRKPRGDSGLNYSIPDDNPFVGQDGRDEIWSIGLRNPFRFSFHGDDIAIGDVGQNAVEEVDIVPIATARGADFGWPAFEGDQPYDPSRPGSGALISPIHTYPHTASPPADPFAGISVIGGLYPTDPRLDGTALDSSLGRYLFAEAFIQPTIRSVVPDVATQTSSDLQSHNLGLGSVVDLAEDQEHRIYAVSLTGAVSRIDPASVPRKGAPVGDGQGSVSLDQVGGNFDKPVNSAFAPGETNKVYVVEQDGTVQVVVNGVPQPQPFLDISNLTNGSGEQGLLGLAFHPDYQTNHLVYAYYNDKDTGDVVVSEFDATNPLDADESSRRKVISVRHRFASNHNGGQVLFGPDGYMYLATGDGGAGGDPRENAQDKGSLLGKLIRIDPLESGGDPYSVPADNPYVGRDGRDEIYALGLRNPFRFNFDPDSGNIEIGDVGQDRFEEVDIESANKLAGANFGWDRYEGFKRYHAFGDDSAGKPTKKHHDEPVLAYSHDFSAAVVGGLIVHDPALTNLFGRYVFADFYGDRLRSFVPQLGKVHGYEELDNSVDSISSFHEDPVTREVYVTSLGQGRLYVLNPAP